MKLNHINLTSSDPVADAQFLAKYLGLRIVDKSNKNFIFMSDDNDMVFALMKGKNISYPDMFHIGFIQKSAADVDEINAKLKADGIDVEAPKRFHAWTFYVKTPGGIRVEVLA